MKKLGIDSLEDRVMKFFKYRITPQSTTGQAPSDLLFGRRLCSHLDLLRPDLSSKVHQKQNSQSKSMTTMLKNVILLLTIKSSLRTIHMVHHGFQV